MRFIGGSLVVRWWSLACALFHRPWTESARRKGELLGLLFVGLGIPLINSVANKITGRYKAARTDKPARQVHTREAAEEESHGLNWNEPSKYCSYWTSTVPPLMTWMNIYLFHRHCCNLCNEIKTRTNARLKSKSKSDMSEIVLWKFARNEKVQCSRSSRSEECSKKCELQGTVGLMRFVDLDQRLRRIRTFLLVVVSRSTKCQYFGRKWIMATLGLSKVFILDKYFTELQKFWETEKKLQGECWEMSLELDPSSDFHWLNVPTNPLHCSIR